MGRFVDITGENFGRLTANNVIGRNKHNQLLWNCTCECGNETVVLGFLLRQGQTQSCGCLHRDVMQTVFVTHGKAGTPIYAVWRSMMQRCYDKNSHAYDRYGGRSVSVCERWQDFTNFYADMGERQEGMSLERVDNDGDYSPENVVWADSKAQARNRRSTIYLEHDGQRKSMAEWAEETGVKIATLWARVNRGMPVDIALTKGVRGHA
jgi:hypothetical protein